MKRISLRFFKSSSPPIHKKIIADSFLLVRSSLCDEDFLIGFDLPYAGLSQNDRIGCFLANEAVGAAYFLGFVGEVEMIDFDPVFQQITLMLGTSEGMSRGVRISHKGT
jgi:hypothetical protein